MESKGSWVRKKFLPSNFFFFFFLLCTTKSSVDLDKAKEPGVRRRYDIMVHDPLHYVLVL